MTAEMQNTDGKAPKQKLDELPRPRSVQRTPVEKACILARLTLQLAALDYERRANGNA